MVSPTPDTPAIRVTGLRRTYGSGDQAFEAVRGLDLTVARGTVHALLGVNGAGKTSTMEVIEGLAPATAGTVEVLGLDPIADRAAVRARTGVLLQKSGFVGDLTVTETLTMWGATVTGARPVPELIEMLDLGRIATTRMRALSGGEQRRVDLACTLTGRPELVMLDEPTTGLDPESRRAVWGLVRELRDAGATVLLTTHYLDEAEELADTVSIMRAGRIVTEGTVAEVVEAHPSEITVDATPAALALLEQVVAVHGAELVRPAASDRVTLRTHTLQRTLTDLLGRAAEARVDLHRLDARTATLESVFLALAEEATR